MHIVLYQPEIPQNTGNIGRTCVALGATLWLVRPLGFRLDHARLKRAGLDYWDALDVRDVADWDDLNQRLGAENPGRWWYFTKRGELLYDEIEYGGDDVLVFGSETQGLPSGLLAGQATVQIPILPPVRSLNLSNAVAIAAYQARPRS
ncbi:MAG: tRNA (cytidine(34)-2'-O)-methyltransferase [Planctomycetales bacterium]|nr:tRNA (cytidine(34)-2'-O)-methyltransferase [Planctomycetales bacterium]